LIICFSDFRSVDLFRNYLHSKSKVIRNPAEYWTLFALPHFGGPHPFKELYPLYNDCLAPRRLVKFRKVTPTNPEVIFTHMLNFKPNF